MKNHISISLALSLILVSGMIGLTAGYFLSPPYQTSMYDKTTMDLGVADRYLDLRYLNQMIAHHLGAIALANKVDLNNARPEIKNLVAAIKADEPQAIEQLYAYKKAWYRDSRPVATPLVVELGQPDSKMDLRFLNALIAHHEAGLIMTKEAKLKSSRSEILDNAQAVEDFLNKTLVTFKDWRESWYGIK